jgi:hypothetical protein
VLLGPGDPWETYTRTVVEIALPGGPVVVRAAPAGTAGEWLFESGEPVFILTAWDPGAERPSTEENRMHQSALVEELHRWSHTMWPAIGVDPLSAHREEGVAVSGLSTANAVALGARYRQDAIFVWTPGEWVILACAGGRRLASGWSLTDPGYGR